MKTSLRSFTAAVVLIIGLAIHTTILAQGTMAVQYRFASVNGVRLVLGVYHHELWAPVPDYMVWVDMLRVVIPNEFLDAMPIHHRESDIFKYQFEVFGAFDDIPMSSAWLLTFFENRNFVALVWKPDSLLLP
jgi:hypothetical protein